MAEGRVYLNECSIEKVGSSDEWMEIIKETLECSKVINNMGGHVTTFYFYPNFYMKEVVEPSQTFTQWLNAHKEIKRSITSLYKTSVDKRLLQDINSQYIFSKQDVSGTSMAESYESVKSGIFTLLINFKLDFPSPLLEVEKKGDCTKCINSFHMSDKLTEYLQTNGFLPKYYDFNSKNRPQDSQTILADKTLFTPTKYGNRKNRLYERQQVPDQLWCLDRGHRGTSVHLEVFSKNSKMQIAVSRHDKIDFFRDLDTTEKSRKLNLQEMP